MGVLRAERFLTDRQGGLNEDFAPRVIALSLYNPAT